MGTFVTTISMDPDLRADLDLVRAKRTRKTGRPQTMSALVIEAVKRLVAKEIKR